MPDVPVALDHAESYTSAGLSRQIGDLLDAARISPKNGDRILVKPNLLMAHRLSCASPQVTACACAWLLDHNAKLFISDSPAFGTARSVARAIGLQEALNPLGLSVKNFSRPRRIKIELQNGDHIYRMIAPQALNADMILSIPRLKAHSQMRLTLAVKNCFGCIYGLHKALAHGSPNLTVETFADHIAALWSRLPPAAGLCDGITAMSVTGPRNGKALFLGILAASASAAALDRAILQIPGLAGHKIPLAEAMRRRALAGDEKAWPEVSFPLQKPQDFDAGNFVMPQKLKNISFNPWVLAKSLLRRIYKKTFS